MYCRDLAKYRGETIRIGIKGRREVSENATWNFAIIISKFAKYNFARRSLVEFYIFHALKTSRQTVVVPNVKIAYTQNKRSATRAAIVNSITTWLGPVLIVDYLQSFKCLIKKISLPSPLANRCKYHRPILLSSIHALFHAPTISPIMPYNTPICQAQRLIEVSITGQHRRCRRTTASWHGYARERRIVSSHPVKIEI